MKQPIIFLGALFILFSPVTHASASLQITEIKPSGDEWVEIYNPTTTAIDLSRYRLIDAADQTIALPSDTPIAPQAYLVVKSSQILNNSGDTVTLWSEDRQLQSVTYPKGISEDQSYQRCPGSQEWMIDTTTAATATASDCATPSPSPTSTPQPSLTATPLPTPTAIASTPLHVGLRISEVYPHPSPGHNEWVEIENTGSTTAELNDWYLDDHPEQGGSPQRFSVAIPAGEFRLIEINQALLNNSGDTVTLLSPDNTIVDQTEYTESSSDVSYGRAPQSPETYCQMRPSPGSQNTDCIGKSDPPASQTSTEESGSPETQTSAIETSPSTEPNQSTSSLGTTTNGTSRTLKGTPSNSVGTYPQWTAPPHAQELPPSPYEQVRAKGFASIATTQQQYRRHDDQIILLSILAIGCSGYAFVSILIKRGPRIWQRYWHSRMRSSILNG